MGLFDRVFGRKRVDRPLGEYWQLLSGYSPTHTSFSGGLYEMELTRAAIHAFAVNCSKLNPKVDGPDKDALEEILQKSPNSYMTGQQFIYRIATILDAESNAFIVPIYENETRARITGFYPIRYSQCELKEVAGELYIRFSFANGEWAAVEYGRIGHLRNHYYRDDMYGEGSQKALQPTMDALYAQNQAIIAGVKQSATIRFLAQLRQTLKSEDIAAERQRLTQENLSLENEGGVLMYDNKYADIRPVDSKVFTVNAAQQGQIKNNVFDYFGTNEDILQNRFDEDTWNAYYEGKVEPFAIQLSQVLTRMLEADDAYGKRGNSVICEANRLHYASNTTKLNIVSQLVDRGVFNRDDARAIFGLGPLPNGEGQIYKIRGEYINADKDPKIPGEEEPT